MPITVQSLIPQTAASQIATGTALAAEFVDIADDAETGWRYDAETGVFSAPEVVVTEETTEHAKMSPLDFKMCLTSAERIAVKGMLETDIVLADFYAIIEDARLKTVDMNLGSVQQALTYLFTKLVEAGVVASEDKESRIQDVLTGTRK